MEGVVSPEWAIVSALVRITPRLELLVDAFGVVQPRRAHLGLVVGRSVVEG